MARNVVLDEDVSALADAQHGAFALSQLPPGWCSSRLAAERAQRGDWLRICHGVYGLPGILDEWSVPAAWCLAVPSAAVGRLGAALWWRLDGHPAANVELVASHGCRARHPFLRRTSDLAPWEVRLDRPDGCLRVTDSTRTLLDIAAVATPDELERMIESALRQGLTSTARLRARATQLRRPGRAGPHELLAALDRRPSGGGADSDGEVVFLPRLRAAGVPDPVRQLLAGPARPRRARWTQRLLKATAHGWREVSPSVPRSAAGPWGSGSPMAWPPRRRCGRWCRRR